MSKLWRGLTYRKSSRHSGCHLSDRSANAPILNTTNAYFKVLNAIDVLSIRTGRKRLSAHRHSSESNDAQRFNDMGLVAITDVPQNARAQYDTVLANEVTARNNTDNAVEELRRVTAVLPRSWRRLTMRAFTLCDIKAVNALLKEAENRNLCVAVAGAFKFRIGARQIRQAQDGHLPTLNLTASTGISDTSYSGSKNQLRQQYDDSNMRRE